MALSKKRHGFRTIIIDNQTYHWRFSGTIDIRPLGKRNNKLIIDFGWFDVWLYVNDKENRPPEYKPKRVTPQFVKESILSAIDLGWDIEKENGEFLIKYKESKFVKGE